VAFVFCSTSKNGSRDSSSTERFCLQVMALLMAAMQASGLIPNSSVLYELSCGVVLSVDNLTTWTFDFSSMLQRTLVATHLSNRWRYVVSPCGVTPYECRPAYCNGSNSSCHPLLPALPSRGAAIQVAADAEVPVFPAPTHEQACYEGTHNSSNGSSTYGVETPCSPVCNVLGPVASDSLPGLNGTLTAANLTKSTWEVAEWTQQAPNVGGVRLQFAEQTPAWFWMLHNGSAPSKRACPPPAGRTFALSFQCMESAKDPELLPPSPDKDGACDVALVIQTAEACFNFTWVFGPWGECIPVSKGSRKRVQTRRVTCVEASGRSTAETPSLCPAHSQPLQVQTCLPQPPADHPLNGVRLLLLIAGVLLLVVSLTIATYMIVTQHRAAVQRRRFLAMTSSYAGLTHSCLSASSHEGGGYYGLSDNAL